MPAVDQARDWICDHPRKPSQPMYDWIRETARFYRIGVSLCKKLYYREKKGIDADVYGRMADIHAQLLALQASALQQRGTLNDITFAISDYRRDQRTRAAAQSGGADSPSGSDGDGGSARIRAKA